MNIHEIINIEMSKEKFNLIKKPIIFISKVNLVKIIKELNKFSKEDKENIGIGRKLYYRGMPIFGVLNMDEYSASITEEQDAFSYWANLNGYMRTKCDPDNYTKNNNCINKYALVDVFYKELNNN